MPRNLAHSAFMKPFVVLALPGMYLFYKYNQYKQQQQEQSKRKVTERELAHLNHKIDKLLTKLEENEPEMATSQEDECVICVNAKATMQTSPCGHRVVCRKCFVKTIQMAVSQRLLPLRCVICRAKILRLKQSNGHGLVYSKSWLMPSSASSYSMSAKSWSGPGSYSSTKSVPSSASQYSVGARSVPNSASMYSMSSGSSSLSGVSSVSSATNASTSSKGSSLNGIHCYPRQPTGSLRKSQHHSMKIRLQEYNELREEPEINIKPNRLPPIKEFQREFRLGKEKASGSSSTRIRCARKIVTQLETTAVAKSPLRKKETPSPAKSSSSFFLSSLNLSNNKEEKRITRSEEKKKDKRKEEKATCSSESLDRGKDIKNNKKVEKNDLKNDKTDKKEEKKELTKSEKKEMKKELKAEKKNAKKEAKAAEKKEKENKNEKK